MAAEIVRERVLLETEEELPYATTVIVDNFEEGAKLTRISATIYCEREGQKGILIGKEGTDAETDWHFGSPADRAHAGDESFSRTLREGATQLAGIARLRGRTRLEKAIGESDEWADRAAENPAKRGAKEKAASRNKKP